MSTAAQPSPKVFLSHASSDEALAQELCASLEAEGIICWIAPRDVTPGRPYSDEIVRGIGGCGAFLLLATVDAVASKNVLNELEQAHRASRQIYTVMVDRPKVSAELGYYIARLHWLEATPRTIKVVAERLSQVLQSHTTWEAVATQPSLGRRVRTLLPSFIGSLAAAVLILVLIALLGYHFLSRAKDKLAMDYRSLGWVTLAATSKVADQFLSLSGQVWLGDDSEEFAGTKLLVTSQGEDGPAVTTDLTKSLDGAGAGHAAFTMRLPPQTQQVRTILTVRNAAVKEGACVTQLFKIRSVQGALQLNAESAPVVSKAGAAGTCGGEQ